MKIENLVKVIDKINYEIIESIDLNGGSENGGNDEFGFYPRVEFNYVTDVGISIKYNNIWIYDEENDGSLSEISKGHLYHRIRNAVNSLNYTNSIIDPL